MSTFSQIILTPVILYFCRCDREIDCSLLLLFVLSKAYISDQTSGVLHPTGSSLEESFLAPCQGRIPSDPRWYFFHDSH